MPLKWRRFHVATVKRMRTECWIRCPVWVVAALLFPLFLSPAYGGATGGYAELVRQVGPSVVTVLVEEKREGAAQRAAERATANSDPAGVSDLLRRLLTGPGNAPMHHDGGDAQGSGFVIRADGLIVTNRHVIVSARAVQVKLPRRGAPARESNWRGRCHRHCTIEGNDVALADAETGILGEYLGR